MTCPAPCRWPRQMMTHTRLLTSLAGLSMAISALAGPATAAVEENFVLQCSGEARSRLLAFSPGDLEIEERRDSDRRIHIHIRNSRRATIMDHPSGEVLFGPSQCKLFDLKIACEIDDGNSSRQAFISRTSGDAMFEGYSQTSDEKSTLVVERYACVKEAREPLF